MELRQLEYFVTAVHEGTIARAARTLYLAQPSLSAQIRKLENELGTPLLERLGRRLGLTHAGQAFLPYAEQVLQTVADGRTKVKHMLAASSGRITLGALPSVDAGLLPALLKQFAGLHPDIEVGLAESNTATDFETLVHQGELDLAIKRLPCERADLESRLLVREPLLLCLPAGHRLAKMDAVPLKDLEQEHFVSLKPGNGLRSHLFDLCRSGGFEPRISFETGQLDGIRAMVLAGCGLAILPRMLTDEDMISRPLLHPNAFRELGIVWRPGPAFPRAAAVFLDFLDNATRSMR